MESSLIKPVYLRNSDIQVDKEKPITDYYLAQAVRKTVPDIKCIQRDRQLWRVYLKSKESRDKLTLDGFDLDSRHISVFETNPYSAGIANPDEKILRVTIKGIPLSVDDQCIRDMLQKFDFVEPTSELKYENIRDPTTRKMTDILNGNRFIYIKALDNGRFLPRNAYCAGLKCQIYHQGQPNTTKKPLCTNCWSTEHFRNKCTSEPLCKVCKEKGHLPGSEKCKYYVSNRDDDEEFVTLNGSKNVLSNFYMNDILVYGVTYKSAEHALQHIKALRCGDMIRAELIKDAKDPLTAKKIGDQIIDTEHWRKTQNDVMRDILDVKSAQVKLFYKVLEKSSDNTKFVLASKDDVWGSGLDHDSTLHTKSDQWPGENVLGKTMKELAEKVKKSRPGSSSNGRSNCARSRQRNIPDMFGDWRQPRKRTRTGKHADDRRSRSEDFLSHDDSDAD